MFRDDPWCRLEIRSSTYPNDVIRIDFVRCAPPDEMGIRWARASWRERFVFENSLRYWANSTANFVTDFDGHQSPTGDVRSLRLIVTEFDGKFCPIQRMVISGHFNEMPDKTFEDSRRENSTHSLVLSWLTADLKRSLAPFLAEHPLKCWSVSLGAGVAINLDEYKARKRPIQNCHYGTRYIISLVEEIGENQFENVPWRNKDVELLRMKIQEMLNDSDDSSWTTDEPRRVFESYVTEE